MFIKNFFILLTSIIICGNVHSQKSGETFEQQFDRQIGYIRFVLQYASDHNVDSYNQQAVSGAVMQATRLFNLNYPQLDFGVLNYTDIKSFSLQPGSYPRETHQYITRIRNAVYDAKNSRDFIRMISSIKRDILDNSLLSELMKLKLLAVSTGMVRFSDTDGKTLSSSIKTISTRVVVQCSKRAIVTGGVVGENVWQAYWVAASLVRLTVQWQERRCRG